MSDTSSVGASKKKPAGPRHWTKEEDDMLTEAVQKLGPKQWKTIAEHVPSRTHTQCLQRWNKVLRPGLLKGPWSQQEDHLLRGLVKQSLASLAREKSLAPKMSCETVMSSLSSNTLDSLETASSPDGDSDSTGGGDQANRLARKIDWVIIAENIPGRSVKQCRDRWCSNLDPNIRKEPWSEEEDRILIETQAHEGNCWAHIARLLPGRTEHAVKTRYRSILRARRREWTEDEDKLLLEQHKIHGSQWADIATAFHGRRKKNAVMTRFKQLQALRKGEMDVWMKERRLSISSSTSSSTTNTTKDNAKPDLPVPQESAPGGVFASFLSEPNPTNDIITIKGDGSLLEEFKKSQQSLSSTLASSLYPHQHLQANVLSQFGPQQQLQQQDQLQSQQQDFSSDFNTVSSSWDPPKMQDAINLLLESQNQHNQLSHQIHQQADTATPINQPSQSFAFGWKSVSPTVGSVNLSGLPEIDTTSRKRPLPKRQSDSWANEENFNLFDSENDSAVHNQRHAAAVSALANPFPQSLVSSSSAYSLSPSMPEPSGFPPRKRTLQAYPSSSHSVSSIFTLASLSSSKGGANTKSPPSADNEGHLFD